MSAQPNSAQVQERVVTCHYCTSQAQLVTGDVLYPHRKDLAAKFFWACLPCRAWVGTHENSPTHAPLGILACAELRSLKQRVHALFDPLWRVQANSPIKRVFGSRPKAYEWLAKELQIPLTECHVGMFDGPRCKEALRILRLRWDLAGALLPITER